MSEIPTAMWGGPNLTSTAKKGTPEVKSTPLHPNEVLLSKGQSLSINPNRTLPRYIQNQPPQAEIIALLSLPSIQIDLTNQDQPKYVISHRSKFLLGQETIKRDKHFFLSVYDDEWQVMSTPMHIGLQFRSFCFCRNDINFYRTLDDSSEAYKLSADWNHPSARPILQKMNVAMSRKHFIAQLSPSKLNIYDCSEYGTRILTGGQTLKTA